MPESENPKLDDSIKLAIRDEVERRFEHPPDAFSKRVEDEVKRRVADKEKWYRAYAIIASLALTSILFVWYHATLATVGEKVVEQLAEKRVTEARDRIMKLDTDVQDRSLRVSNLTESVQANYTVFANRLAQIKQQDNIILMDDLPKVFVIETVTALVNGTTIVLEHDPIPQTVILSISSPLLPLPYWRGSRLEGRTIDFTNNLSVNPYSLTNALTHHTLTVEYVRASKTDR